MAHQRQHAAEPLITGQGQIIVAVVVVVVDKAGRVVVIRRGKVKPCLHTAVQVLLPCCQQALPEAGLKALRTVQPQPAGTRRQAGAVAQRLPQALQPVIPNSGVKLLRPIHPLGTVAGTGQSG